MSKLRGIELLIFPYEQIDEATLAATAQRVIPAGSKKRSGKNPARMRSYLAGRSALAVGFQRLGISAFVRPNDTFGYLEVVDEQGQEIKTLFVNISHTETMVAAVISPSAVGVDIEREDRDASRVIKRVGTAFEIEKAIQGVFANNGRPIKYEIALWSAKEAVSKAFGLGMKFGLKEFEIIFGGNLPYSVRTSLKGPLAVPTPIVTLDLFNEYLISVCVDESAFQLGGIRRGLISPLDF